MPTQTAARLFAGTQGVRRLYHGNDLVWQIPTVIDRSGLVVGVDKPDSANTGALPATNFTVTSTHAPASNTTYRDLDIRNVVNLNGKTGVKYVNCILRGDATAPTGSAGLVRAWTTHGRGHSFTDCTFAAQTPSWNLNGIQGYGFTLTRCDISGVVDGVSVFNTNAPSDPCDVVIDACYIHDQAYWPNPPDTNHADGSHCDGVQWQGCPGLTIRGTTIIGTVNPQSRPGQFGTNHTNACLMIKPDAGAISGGFIDRNWFYGSSIGVQVANDAPDRYVTELGQFTNNRFDHSQRGQGSGPNDTWTVQKPAATTWTAGGNVYEDTNTAIRVRLSA